jgi:hypothetical protein
MGLGLAKKITINSFNGLGFGTFSINNDNIGEARNNEISSSETESDSTISSKR